MWQSETLQSLRPKAGQVFSARFFVNRNFPDEWWKTHPKWSKTQKFMCQIVKQFFSYNHLHFISFYLFCVADSSTHIQNISGQFAPCHPYHLPTVTRFSWNDLRSLIRKKIVSNLCQSCWSGKSIPSCRDNCVSKSELFIWVFPKIGVPPNHPSYIIGFSIINHPFWGTTIFGNTQIKTVTDYKYDTFCLWNMTSCPI